jgi:hypothetical protein
VTDNLGWDNDLGHVLTPLTALRPPTTMPLAS